MKQRYGAGSSQRTSSPCPRAPRASTVAARLRDDVLHDREPEAGPARRPSAIGAVEALEEARQLRLLDPDAVVAADQDHRVPVALRRRA